MFFKCTIIHLLFMLWYQLFFIFKYFTNECFLFIYGNDNKVCHIKEDICKSIFREMYEIQICQAHMYTLYMFQDILTKDFFKKLYLLQFKTINMAYQTLKNERKQKQQQCGMDEDLAWLCEYTTPITDTLEFRKH